MARGTTRKEEPLVASVVTTDAILSFFRSFFLFNFPTEILYTTDLKL